MPRTSRNFVAVVVFLSADGADAHDSINVGEQIVAEHLHAATGVNGQLAIETRAGLRLARIGQIVELGRAYRADLIKPITAAVAYKA